MQLPMNADQLRAAFSGAASVLLTGPKDPDGDSIGACLALARGVQAVSDAEVFIAGEVNYRYDWMPGADAMLADSEVSGDYDMVVVLDGDRTRLTPMVEAAFAAAKVRGIVDHHKSTSADGYDVVVLDAAATSTCEMVHALLVDWGVALDASLATYIYTGVVFDTGGFRHSNTGPDTHQLAAVLLEQGINTSMINAKVLAERTQAGLRLLGDVLTRAQFHGDGQVVIGQVPLDTAQSYGIASGDLEGIIDALLNTAGVEVACLAVERGSAQTKLSLRSRQLVDVASLARSLDAGGGGHVRAAGVTLLEPLSSVMARLPDVLSRATAEAS